MLFGERLLQFPKDLDHSPATGEGLLQRRNGFGQNFSGSPKGLETGQITVCIHLAVC